MPELPEGFDLDSLLAPIPGDAPQGSDLREDFSAQSPYFRLRDARSEARDAEKASDRGDSDPRDPGPLWRVVRDVGLKALSEGSKDLEVAAWVTEALVRLDGLRGLTGGSLLMKGLAEQYWDNLFPMPDEYGMETRVAPVTGLNGRDGAGSLIQPLFKLALFERPDGTPVTLHTWQQSEQLATIDAAAQKRRLEAGVVALDDLSKEARAAGNRYWAQFRVSARDAHNSWQAMSAAMDERAGADGPSTTQVRDVLARLLDVANRFAPAEEAPAADAAVAETSASEEAASAPVAAGGGVRGPGQIANREDALRVLTEIATWFRRTEPHSPMAYTLEEAVRRGRLTWPELLEELVSEEASRHAILNSLGIRPPQPPAEA